MTLSVHSAMLQRRLKIAEWIRQHGQMRVDELSTALSVSEVTIRSDLTYLEEQGLILRSFGKAVAAKTIAPRERANASLLSKALTLPMLRLASMLVEPDQTILIGPGVLPGQIIPLLAEFSGLSMVLSTLEAVPLARACLDGRVHLLGGELDVGAGTLEGVSALRNLVHYPVGIAVLEADGLTTSGSLLLPTKFGAQFLEAACRHAARSIVLVHAPSVSLETRPSQVPIKGATDLIFPALPSQRARLVLDDGGFRFVAAEPGMAVRFSREAAAR
jgi:DeoR/GlpR family transcriptional regulator of sugar metabolism